MLYLIGLGLDKEDISLKALEALEKCEEVYLETYTTTLPYKISELENIIKKKIIILGRDKVESDFLVERARKHNVALLVYGDPLSATTHFALLEDAKKKRIKAEVIHNVSILNAISNCGLSLYKFGKTTSLPRWQENYKPTSFYDVIKENLSINAHTLLLVDPGLSLKEAIEQLNKADKDNLLKNKNIIVASRVGTSKEKILVGKISKLLRKKVEEPFCLIVPAVLNFFEKIKQRR
ncbi:MAG: diphthine synthase [Candidatus Pacearchaeota archaeon]